MLGLCVNSSLSAEVREWQSAAPLLAPDAVALMITQHTVARRYAGLQLTWLIEKSTDTADDAYLRKLQQNILECDRRGALNANLPSGAPLGP